MPDREGGQGGMVPGLERGERGLACVLVRIEGRRKQDGLEFGRERCFGVRAAAASQLADRGFAVDDPVGVPRGDNGGGHGRRPGEELLQHRGGGSGVGQDGAAHQAVAKGAAERPGRERRQEDDPEEDQAGQ